MKPALSPIVTSVLPSRAASASTSSTTDGSVTTVRTTSTSFMTGAGLKKCMPMTLLGRPVTTESSVTERLEVLVARIVSGGQILSSAEKTSVLSSIRSGIASITSSAVGEILQRRAEPDPLEHRIPVRRVQLAAADGTAGGVLEVATTAGDRLVVDLDRGHRQARPGEHLDDPGTHGAEPDDADLVQFSGHAATPPRIDDPRQSLTPGGRASGRQLPAGNRLRTGGRKGRRSP